ncbi:hypothetical protein ACFWSF_35130 [Streptomyces sp. NPDC058611]|uniref:hypothetical protein n=1 Tax=unclassified Streptomyces TaxID=2593676 RepID=UPI0036476F55
MRQPEPSGAIEELRDFLSFSVPLRAAELAHKITTWRYSRAEAVTWLTSECRRAGISVGGDGDVLQFSDGRPRVGRAQIRVAHAAGDLANGVAAASLLAQLQGQAGVRVFGDFYGVARPSRGAVPSSRAARELPSSQLEHGVVAGGSSEAGVT